MAGFDQDISGTDIDYSVLIPQAEQVIEGLEEAGYSTGEHPITEGTGAQIDHFHRPRDLEVPRGYRSIDQETDQFNDIWTKVGYDQETGKFEARVVAMEDGFYGVAAGDSENIDWRNFVDEPTYHNVKHPDGFQAVFGYSDGSFDDVEDSPYLGEVHLINDKPLSEEVDIEQWTDAYPVFNREAVSSYEDTSMGQPRFGIVIDADEEDLETLSRTVLNTHQTIQNIDSLQNFQDKTKRNF